MRSNRVQLKKSWMKAFEEAWNEKKHRAITFFDMKMVDYDEYIQGDE